MGAGIMQLLFFGQQDIYLKSNPSITFFKKVFKTHTNFAMESIKVELNKTDTNIYQTTVLKAKIPRHADLVSQIYFVFEIPEIISDNIMGFRWIPNLGEAIISNYYISVGGSIIDKHYGEYLHIMNNLTSTADKRRLFDSMTGNTLQLTEPDTYAMQTNNLISHSSVRYRIGSAYPTYKAFDPTKPDDYQPSIPTRKIYVPLRFWFNKDIGSALPLVSLQYSEVEITIELRPWAELYKLFYKKNGAQDYYAPNLYIEAHQMKNFVSNYRQKFLLSDTVIDCRCSLECNYIYLDTLERQYFAYKPLDYLIEQLTQINKHSIQENTVLDLVLQNPVKEVIWVTKRNDIGIKNDWFNFTDNYEKIMLTAKLMFNGMDRMEEKDAEYYNYVQPYQHHTSCGKDGLYVYSFAVFPEKYQPSGSVNCSRINNIQFYMKSRKPRDTSYKYDVTFYAINYNFLRISSGLAGVVYNS
jgi:hypothetical protein